MLLENSPQDRGGSVLAALRPPASESISGFKGTTSAHDVFVSAANLDARAELGDWQQPRSVFASMPQ